MITMTTMTPKLINMGYSSRYLRVLQRRVGWSPFTGSSRRRERSSGDMAAVRETPVAPGIAVLPFYAVDLQ
jgi:hypothetical protein